MIETQGDTYIDDLTAKTDYEIPKYFRNTYNENAKILNTGFYEELINVNKKDTKEEDIKEEDTSIEDKTAEKSSYHKSIHNSCNIFFFNIILIISYFID